MEAVREQKKKSKPKKSVIKSTLDDKKTEELLTNLPTVPHDVDALETAGEFSSSFCSSYGCHLTFDKHSSTDGNYSMIFCMLFPPATCGFWGCVELAPQWL